MPSKKRNRCLFSILACFPPIRGVSKTLYSSAAAPRPPLEHYKTPCGHTTRHQQTQEHRLSEETPSSAVAQLVYHLQKVGRSSIRRPRPRRHYYFILPPPALMWPLYPINDSIRSSPIHPSPLPHPQSSPGSQHPACGAAASKGKSYDSPVIFHHK